jgi:hypothetical protein
MQKMKVAGLFLGAALLFSSAVFAAEENKGSLKLSDNVTVDGKTINSGDYNLEWSGNGPAVQVTVLRNNNPVATLTAHVAEQSKPTPQDGYGTTIAPDGSRTLTAIYPGGKRIALRFDGSGASASAGN